MNIGVALLTDRNVHNLARETTFHMNEKYKTGFESALLPQHISLKQSFVCDNSIDEITEYLEQFCNSLIPFRIRIEKIEVNRFGEDEKILAWLRITECKELREIHNRLCTDLEKKFGIAPVGFDGEQWKFHTTLAYTQINCELGEKLIYEYNNRPISIEYEPKEIVLFYSVESAEKSTEYISYRIFKMGQ